MMDLTRKPFDAQAHAITGIVKGWRQSKSIILCAEMGTGKTMMGICAGAGHLHPQAHAGLLQLPAATASVARSTGHGSRREPGPTGSLSRQLPIRLWANMSVPLFYSTGVASSSRISDGFSLNSQDFRAAS